MILMTMGSGGGGAVAVAVAHTQCLVADLFPGCAMTFEQEGKRHSMSWDRYRPPQEEGK